MIDFLNNIDQQLLLALNGAHCPYADNLMWLISSKLSSALLLIVFFVILSRKGWKTALATLLVVAVVVLLADRISSGLIKPLVERLRPTHNPQIGNLVHVVNDYRGGQYGFVSSHAANLFGVAVLVSLIIKNRLTWCLMIGWAALVSYSRIYLGVHYPGDVLCGALIGGLVAALCYRAANSTYLPAKWQAFHLPPAFSKNEYNSLNITIVANLLLLCVIAFF